MSAVLKPNTSFDIRPFDAELVFGTTSGKGGLGWYIFQSRSELFTDQVFAGLVAVILIGLLRENLVFDSLERLTVRRWGMQR